MNNFFEKFLKISSIVFIIILTVAMFIDPDEDLLLATTGLFLIQAIIYITNKYFNYKIKK